MSRHYTGVGSRETPDEVLDLMRALGQRLADRGFILRTGGAQGADQAFELGWVWHIQSTPKEFTKAEVFLPWDGFEGHTRDAMFGANILPDLDNPGLYKKALEIAEKTHPAWDRCSRGAKTLHARNVYQVLGQDLATPSKFLIAWAPVTKAGKPKGGTATAIALAESYGVPCFNLILPEHSDRIHKFLEASCCD